VKITHNGSVFVVGDGTGANLGLGILVPALAVGIFSWLIWPPIAGNSQVLGSVISFVVTAVTLAVLTPPHTTAFDRDKREVHIAAGWPPVFGRERTISFADISEAAVWRRIDMGELGPARPVLILNNGRKVFLSGYKQSPKKCRPIIGAINTLLGDTHQSHGDVSNRKTKA
jgi:hypothetical protein